MAGGRPSKYEPQFCEQLVEHMAQGYPLDTFAAVLKINPDTLYEWAKVHPEFSEAIKEGRARSLKWFMDIGKAAMVGAKNPETKEVISVNPTFWIFMMKNMHKWRDRSEIEHNGGDKPLKFENLSDEEIKKRTKEALRILGVISEPEE